MEWHTEHATTASGMTHTIPRDSFYADLFSDLRRQDWPYGRTGRSGPRRRRRQVHPDAGKVAATVLERPESHTDRTHMLTGPEAVSVAASGTRRTATLGRSFHSQNRRSKRHTRCGAPDTAAAWSTA
jgi:uncharacterized protein YbjT (DUF2867 family)